MTLIETFMEARLFITGFLVMAAGTFIWWLWYERRNRKLIESGGTETTATVERYQTGTSSAANHELMYRFTAADGDEVYRIDMIEDRVFMEEHYPPGSVIRITYAPSSPRSTCRLSESFLKDIGEAQQAE